MKILVTGGAGFIGSNFVNMALRGDFNKISEIVVIDKFTYAASETNIDGVSGMDYELINGDICNPEQIATAIKGVDVVINFAAESHVDNSINDGTQFMQSNFIGVFNILDQIRVSNSGCKLIQVSTDEVYGSLDSESANETQMLDPSSPYSASKAGSDLLALAYRRTFGLDVIVTRCCNNFGPRQHQEKLIPKIIHRVLSGEKIPIYGAGMNIREWIFVEDHCRAIYAIIVNSCKESIYNIGTGIEISNIDIAKVVCDHMSTDMSRIQHVEDRLGHDFRYSLDSSRIRHEFAWVPLVPLEAGIRSTIDWYSGKHS